MKSLMFTILPGYFAIHRLQPDASTMTVNPNWTFFSITKTAEEISIVIPEDVDVPSENVEKGWRCLMVQGPLDFSLTGILAEISGILAKAKISIFAISTFDTDYVLVKKENLENAKIALKEYGHQIL